MKYVLVLAVLCSFGVARAQQDAAIDSNYIFSGYTENLARFKKMPVLKGAIIFLGNSLTDAGRWNDIVPELPVLNRGISGDISFGVLARLDEIVRHKPAKVFLMIGVNDLKRNVPPAYIIANYRKIVQEIRSASPQTIIYLNSVLPVNEQKLIAPFRAVKNQDIQTLNKALLEISKNSRQVQYVDLHMLLADSKGDLRPEITPDGIHLEVAAYVDVVNYLKKLKVL
ncbi:MAG: GDSL-type esterase/lipase family protein [Niabella sp.]